MFASLPRLEGRNSIFVLFLGALFVASFAVPLIFAVKFGSPVVVSEPTSEESDPVFPDSVNISKKGSFIRVRDSKTLQPESGKDFAIGVWVNFKRVPDQGETIQFLSKIDSKSRHLKGYSLGVTSDGEVIKPVVHWKDGEGKGRTFLFSPFPLIPGVWTFFGVAAIKSQYLGVHAGTMVEADKIDLRLLGGYDLGQEVLPESASDLTLGSIDSTFRGRVGPFGVFSDDDIADDLKDLLKDLTRRPQVWPRAISSSSVRLWAPKSTVDESDSKFSILMGGGLRKSQNQTP